MSGMIIKPTHSPAYLFFQFLYLSPRAFTSFAFNNCETNGSRHFSSTLFAGRERWVLCEGELKTVSIHLSPLFFPESIRPACNKKGKVTDEVHFYFEYSPGDLKAMLLFPKVGKRKSRITDALFHYFHKIRNDGTK